MFNPSKLLKLKSEKDLFVKRHSDLIRFLERNFGSEVREGDELTITYMHQGGVEETVTAKLTQEDVDVIQVIGKMF